MLQRINYRQSTPLQKHMEERKGNSQLLKYIIASGESGGRSIGKGTEFRGWNALAHRNYPTAHMRPSRREHRTEGQDCDGKRISARSSRVGPP